MDKEQLLKQTLKDYTLDEILQALTENYSSEKILNKFDDDQKLSTIDEMSIIDFFESSYEFDMYIEEIEKDIRDQVKCEYEKKLEKKLSDLNFQNNTPVTLYEYLADTFGIGYYNDEEMFNNLSDFINAANKLIYKNKLNKWKLIKKELEEYNKHYKE